jgi:hypothetical protein
MPRDRQAWPLAWERKLSTGWQPYAKEVAEEIEDMYAYGSPHFLYRPDNISLSEAGANQDAAVQGWMVGWAPPANVCTFRILFDLMVEVSLYEGSWVKIRRNGPPNLEREDAIRRMKGDAATHARYKLFAGMANAEAFKLPGQSASRDEVSPTTKERRRSKRSSTLTTSPDSFHGLALCCALCGVAPPEGTKWMQCARCKQTSYCGREHQLEAWKSGGHKQSCGCGLLHAHTDSVAPGDGRIGRSGVGFRSECRCSQLCFTGDYRVN